MRRIPDDNLAYPVLITAGISCGSGFYINSDQSIYLVTARHVLINKETNTFFSKVIELSSYSKNLKDPVSNILSVDLALIEGCGLIKSDLSLDVLVMKIGDVDSSTFMFSTSVGVVVKQVSQLGIIGVQIQNIKRYSDILIANDVFVFGYPVSIGLQHLSQFDYSRPLLRAGIIAGINDAVRSIVLDCPVYPGNSGGPVVEVEQEGFEYRYKIIGVVIEYVPAIAQVVGSTSSGAIVNSGYSIAASMDRVLELTLEIK